MIKPPIIKPGDRVALVATSSMVPKERIQPAIMAMENFGLEVIIGESCNGCYGYLAGSDAIRANDINIMFKNKSIKGIFVIRGGYGAARLLDKLDYNMIRNNPKIFAGYSDVTALHIAFNQLCDFITYHSPMPATELYREVDDFTLNSYKKNIFTEENYGKIENPIGVDIITLVPGKGKGQLIGGNLSLICSSLGTKYEINTTNKILFIEEVEESPYRIDRMLLQLAQAGKLQKLNGIILGSFTDCNPSDPKNSLTILQILNDIIKPLGIPTLYNISCGHALPTLTLPLGSMIQMNATNGEIFFYN